MVGFRSVSSRLLKASTGLLFAAAFGCSIYALWIGIDFGKHWDDWIHYDIVVMSYQSELLLPRIYNYPSMIYWLNLASVSDRLFSIFYSVTGGTVKPDIPFDLSFFISRARVAAMLVSSLGALWIFFALRCSDLARPALAAALGGSFYILSWEFGYHARWLATDLIAAQFVALFVFFIAKADNSKNTYGWLTAAAVAAGLGTATKYTVGGLVPALWLYTLLHRQNSRSALLMTVARQTAVAVGVCSVSAQISA